ncbi:MAG: Asp-tRNA(Asn)/Glu-tRNA(Gln) amidotransferase subunit GatB [Clostridia bacterium]|nr:Asp-tRNA(Asn)/Glu-tRNA(Gln) amidotransferase subunit GatB [Clostridia bacterium]
MEYDIVIGLEVHAELKTKSKVFCSCKNQFGSTPNSNCCPVCIGLPGALPVLNKKAVELVIKAGLCMDCEINDKAVFERKNYFYPDLAKAYQISQLVKPICVGGKIELKDKTVRLNRIHLEEDAGKLVHSSRSIGTLIDYNRGGVPLMELVTEPDISSAEEAVEFLTKLRSILVYSNVADCKMEEGGMRCDVNLSIKPKGSDVLGVRSEMKNLNSFKSVYRAIKYEAQRQIDILEQGGKIVQETRKWDDNKERSYAMRKKETSQDYRYFPDPDMLAVNISRELVSKIKDSLPELADQRFKRYVSYSLTEYESEILTRDKAYSDYFDKALSVYFEPKTIANWFLTDVMSKLKGQDEIKISPEDLALIIKSVDDKVISTKVSKEIFEKAWEEGASVEKLIKELSGNIEGEELRKIVETLVAENEKAVSDYRTTDQPEKVLRWFMGQVMKMTKGKANATQAETMILELIKE